MSGLGMNDADSISQIFIDNAPDSLERSIALRRGVLLALNRGRPKLATKLLRQMNEMRSPSYTFRQFAIAGAVFNDGERSVGDSSARDLAQSLAHDTVGVMTPDATRRVSSAMSILAIWYFEHGDTGAASTASSWLQRHSAGQHRNHVLSVVPAMLISSRMHASNAGALRAATDSVALDGCCGLPDFVPVALAQAFAESGDPKNALLRIKSGMWYQPPRNLSTYLRQEGKLATQVGDRSDAIQAYERYLALRSNVEPSQRAQRDSVESELVKLKALH
jgi:hypothetical protein